MKNRIILAIVGAATLLFPLSGLAQNQQQEGQGQREGFGRQATETQFEKELTPGPGWKTCPRCTNNKQLAAAYKTYKVEGMPSIRRICRAYGATTAWNWM